MKSKDFIGYIYLLIIVIVGIVYMALDIAGAQLDMTYNKRSTHEKEFVTSRSQPDDFVTIKTETSEHTKGTCLFPLVVRPKGLTCIFNYGNVVLRC